MNSFLFLLFATLSLKVQSHSLCNTSLNNNPLLEKSQLALGAFRFDLIQLDHFKPALEASYLLAMTRLYHLIADQSPVTIENTLQTFLNLDPELERVQSLLNTFSDHLATPTNQQMLADLEELSTQLNLKFTEKIYSNLNLYHKFQTLARSPKLTNAQKKMIKNLLQEFERNGLRFTPQELDQFQSLNQQLSDTRTRFNNKLIDQNRLANDYLEVKNPAELNGIPENTLINGKANAKKLGLTGWVFSPATLDYFDIMTYATSPQLRFNMWYRASTSNTRGDQYDTSLEVLEIIKLEQQLAKLQKFDSPAEKYLDGNMVGSADKVKTFYRGFLQQTFDKAKADLHRLQQFKKSMTGDGTIKKWDQLFWLNKFRKSKFSYDEIQMRPYLEFSKVVHGVFDIIKKLFGMELIERYDLPKFHPQVHIYEVKKANKAIGLLYFDPFARDDKKSGAWMQSLVQHEKLTNGQFQNAISLISTDFQQNSVGKTYLSPSDVTTLLHEMGHAIHTFASTAENRYQSGVRGVPSDMVELPSQFMENYFYQYDTLKHFAINEQGEPLPRSLFDAMMTARLFWQANQILNSLLLSAVDIELFSQAKLNENFNILDFENQIWSPYKLYPETPKKLIQGQILNSFSHIMMGGYTAQYYSYLWSEVLSLDAFKAFQETGDVFNQNQAQKFLELLAAGSSQNAGELYRNFRGRDLSFEAFLNDKGLKLE